MNKISLRTQLNNQRVKNIGLIERHFLRKEGESDGAIGLPKQNKDGLWVSPLIEREMNAFQESSDKLYGHLQISTKELYVEANMLTDAIKKSMADIYSIDKEIKNTSSEFDMKKKNKGEENLSNEQIASRRSRELNGMLAGMRNKREQLLDQTEKSYYRLLELKSKIMVLNDVTKFMNEKVKDHTLQRIDLYWNAAYRYYLDQESMPPVPQITLSSNAENVYYERHKNIDEKSMRIIESYESYKEKCEEVK